MSGKHKANTKRESSTFELKVSKKLDFNTKESICELVALKFGLEADSDTKHKSFDT
jgi:hypothetical protein